MPDFQLVTCLHSNISVADVEVGDRLPSIAGACFQLVYASSGEPVDASVAKASSDLELWKAGRRLLTLEGFFAPTVEAKYVYSSSLRERVGSCAEQSDVREQADRHSESGFSWLEIIAEALAAHLPEPSQNPALSEPPEWPTDDVLVFDSEPAIPGSIAFTRDDLKSPVQLSAKVVVPVSKAANAVK